MEIVQDITYSLLLRASNDKLLVGTTKLVKLFYLIDLEYYRWKRKTLTDVLWIFYHYGPYCEELVAAIQKTPGIEPETEYEFAENKFFKGYRVKSFRHDPTNNLHFTIRGVVDDIYKKWASVNLELLLDYVYFETPPMICATRLKPLDFSLVPDPREKTEEEGVKNFLGLIPAESKAMLRNHVRERASKYVLTRPKLVEINQNAEESLLLLGEDD